MFGAIVLGAVWHPLELIHFLVCTKWVLRWTSKNAQKHVKINCLERFRGTHFWGPISAKSVPMQRGAHFAFSRSVPMQRGARFAFCEMLPMQRGSRFVFCRNAPMQRGARSISLRNSKTIDHLRNFNTFDLRSAKIII